VQNTAKIPKAAELDLPLCTSLSRQTPTAQLKAACGLIMIMLPRIAILMMVDGM
jgi:hypothetical protein